MTDPSAGATLRGLHRVDPAEEAGGAGVARELWRRLRREPRIVYRGDGRRPQLALTFDDGPSPWTSEIAAVLEGHDCRATFFVRGPAVAERPADVVALVEAGHELGNHLWSHCDPAIQSAAEIRAELERTDAAVRAAAGRRTRLVRPPYCRAPEGVARASARSGIRMVVQRSIGSSDWSASSPEQVVEPLLAIAGAGDIVCLHDGVSPDERDSDSREVTVAAVRRLVPALLARSLRPVTVSHLLRG